MLARPEPAARPARAGDGEPRRHRPPDARRGDLDRAPTAPARASATSRPRSRRSSWSLADGSVARGLSAAPIPRRWRAARVGLGALGVDLRGDAARGARLHASTASTRRARSTRRPRRPRRARRRARPLRVLRLPPHRDGALPRVDAQPHEPAAAARARRRLRAGGRARELGRGRLRRRSPATCRRAIPRSRGWPPPGPASAPEDRPAATGSSPPSAGSGSPRWSTRSRASTRREAVRAGARVAARPELRGRLPDRGPVRGRRRRAAQPRPRARHRYIAVHQYRGRLAALLRGGRGDHGLLRRPPALGQAPLPDRRRRWRSATRAGTTSRRSARRLDPERRVSPTRTPTACSARSARPEPSRP